VAAEAEKDVEVPSNPLRIATPFGRWMMSNKWQRSLLEWPDWVKFLLLVMFTVTSVAATVMIMTWLLELLIL
jgi:hypothetical protein